MEFCRRFSLLKIVREWAPVEMSDHILSDPDRGKK